MVSGSGTVTAMFLLALLSAIVSLTECYGSYYRLVPRVQFFIDKKPYATIDGDYTSFGSSRDLLKKLLILNEDTSFGCRGNEANETTILSYSVNSVFLLPDSSSPCSVYEKTKYAHETYRASGLIFYRTSMSDASLNTSATTSALRTAAIRGDRRRQTVSSRDPTAVRLIIHSEQLAEFRSKLNTGSTLQVTIEAEIEQRGFRTTQTFYFVVFAFCILMMLSCSWLLLSYFKRCHYRWRLRRNQARTANETRQMVNRLPTKSYKSSKEKGEVPTCVVCLEAFKNNESIRILPCKHEFHKKCIDPWLKIKRNCPMCKQDVFPSKHRQQSSSSSRSNRNSEAGRRRAARASGTSQEMVAVLSLSNDRQRNNSWSSNTSSSSSDLDENSSTTSSNTASNTTQETNASSNSLLHESRGTDENIVDFGVATVITVSPGPAVFEEAVQQQQAEGGGEMVVLEVETSDPVGSSSSERGESDRPEQEQEMNHEPRVSSPQHVQVDMEGVNLLESAPVIIA